MKPTRYLEVAREIEADYERVAYHLAIWREWMKNGKSLGYPDEGHAVNGAALNFDDLCDRADLRSAETMDAIIDSLPVHQACAVYHFNLGAVFRFVRLRVDEVYADALKAMVPMVKKRGLE
ncbi:MAG: hypothetical protein KGI54_17130 [Pseudomonadota bacterium]|nr:hypothetical protein [Pseudomonadota bacterium]